MMSARECRGKVLLELFQKLTVSRGRASCGTAQSAKSLMPPIAQEGRKTVRWTVFRWEPSPGGPSAKHKMIKVSNIIPQLSVKRDFNYIENCLHCEQLLIYKTHPLSEKITERGKQNAFI